MKPQRRTTDHHHGADALLWRWIVAISTAAFWGALTWVLKTGFAAS